MELFGTVDPTEIKRKLWAAEWLSPQVKKAAQDYVRHFNKELDHTKFTPDYLFLNALQKVTPDQIRTGRGFQEMGGYPERAIDIAAEAPSVVSDATEIPPQKSILTRMGLGPAVDKIMSYVFPKQKVNEAYTWFHKTFRPIQPKPKPPTRKPSASRRPPKQPRKPSASRRPGKGERDSDDEPIRQPDSDDEPIRRRGPRRATGRKLPPLPEDLPRPGIVQVQPRIKPKPKPARIPVPAPPVLAAIPTEPEVEPTDPRLRAQLEEHRRRGGATPVVPRPPVRAAVMHTDLAAKMQKAAHMFDATPAILPPVVRRPPPRERPYLLPPPLTDWQFRNRYGGRARSEVDEQIQQEQQAGGVPTVPVHQANRLLSDLIGTKVRAGSLDGIERIMGKLAKEQGRLVGLKAWKSVIQRQRNRMVYADPSDDLGLLGNQSIDFGSNRREGSALNVESRSSYSGQYAQ